MENKIYKKGSRRKNNQLRNKNTPVVAFSLNDVMKKIDERIEWCRKNYEEDKFMKLIDMHNHKNRSKALYRLRSQNDILCSYIRLLTGVHVYILRNDTENTGTILIASILENPNIPVTYCRIDIQEKGLDITSDKISLTSENIDYIKKIIYLSAIGQIS